jgi:excisionase family DNA binding protein
MDSFSANNSDKGAEFEKYFKQQATMKNDIIDEISLKTENDVSKDENNLTNYNSSNTPYPTIKLLTVSQAAKYMSIGRDALKTLIGQGRIGTLKIGKRNKIPLNELETFIKNETLKQTITIHDSIISDRDLDKFFIGRKRKNNVKNGSDILNELMGVS